MAINSSSLIRLSGMNSGFDTEALVQAMSSATKLKIDNNTKKLTTLQWKQEQYRDVISKLTNLQNKFFDVLKPESNLKSSSFMNAFTVSGATDGMSIKTSTSSVAANYKVSVQQLAQKEIYEGSRLPNSFKLDFSAAEGSSKVDGEYSVNITMDDTTKEIKFSGTTAEELATSFNESVENAFGKTTNGEGFVKVDAGGNLTVNGNQNIRITENDGSFGLSKFDSSQNISMSTAVSGQNVLFFRKEGDSFGTRIEFDSVTEKYFDKDALENDPQIKELFDTYKQEAFDKAKLEEGNENLTLEKFSFTAQDAAIAHNSKNLKEAFSAKGIDNVEIADGKIQTTDGSKFSLNSVDGSTFGIYKDSASNVTGRTTSLADLGVSTVTELDLDGNETSVYKFSINEVEIKLSADSKISDLVNAVNSSGAGVTMTYSTLTDSLNIESNVGGNASNIRISDDNGVLSSLNVMSGTHSEGKNAIYTINDKEIQSTSNSYTIDGTTVTFNADVELNKDVNFSTVRDTSAAKTQIMAFVEEYNKAIEEINGYTTQKPTHLQTGQKRYSPLTDEEKAEMTDKQIEQWEEKAKQGLLYSDSTIRDVMSKLRTAIYSGIETKTGENYSLMNMGITTSTNWSDNGKLIIDEDKLNQALEQNFDKVTELFNSENSPLKEFDTQLTRAVKATGAREDKGLLVQLAGLSTGTSVTDNRLYDEMKRLTEYVTQLESRYQDEQTRYWNRFTFMEQQLSALNSQQSYISSMFNIS